MKTRTFRLIAEDKALARNTIKTLVSRSHPDIDIVPAAAYYEWEIRTRPAENALTSAGTIPSRNHTQPDRISVDFDGTAVTGTHVSIVADLRRH